MSVEVLGADLLREVKEEGLNEVCQNTSSYFQNRGFHTSSIHTLTNSLASTLITRARNTLQCSTGLLPSRQTSRCLPKPTHHAAAATVSHAMVYAASRNTPSSTCGKREAAASHRDHRGYGMFRQNTATLPRHLSLSPALEL